MTKHVGQLLGHSITSDARWAAASNPDSPMQCQLDACPCTFVAHKALLAHSKHHWALHVWPSKIWPSQPASSPWQSRTAPAVEDCLCSCHCCCRCMCLHAHVGVTGHVAEHAARGAATVTASRSPMTLACHQHCGRTAAPGRAASARGATPIHESPSGRESEIALSVCCLVRLFCGLLGSRSSLPLLEGVVVGALEPLILAVSRGGLHLLRLLALLHKAQGLQLRSSQHIRQVHCAQQRPRAVWVKQAAS